ncbi:MAG TPA: ThuA domain-containing protein [Chloroflexi bacterium]|jgi:type 1 glutamine amidotransferase|nr:ThuA domain-containing protein [Chloroflexota bacterium]
MDANDSRSDVLAAVVTGNHPYDVVSFQRMLRALEGIDPFVQHIDDLVADAGHVRVLYDVVAFYHFEQETPGTTDDARGQETRTALEEFADTGQGIVLLHHALLAYPGWDTWSQLCGIADRRFTYHQGQSVRVEIAAPDHPITADLAPWEMEDETYVMAEPGADSHVLLTTEHPQSMRSLAWTRQFGSARVFCCTLGHDSKAFGNPNFRTVLRRGMLWAAGRL